MRYSFRLAEILKHEPDPRKRPGTIKAIVAHTGLDRHQVAALLKSEIKYVPLQALSAICQYLIDENYAKAEDLPGILFSVEPENFWEMLAMRKRMVMCLGVRRDIAPEEPGLEFLSASDSIMLGELLSGVTSIGGTAKHRKYPTDGTVAEHSRPIERANPQPEFVTQSLVWSPSQSQEKIVNGRAEEAYSEFAAYPGDKSLVCLGSAKSNPVGEIVIANTFHARPLISQDDVNEPGDRACPFYLRFRDQDPHPNSMMGGTQLAKKDKRDKAGIYYETENGNWVLANEQGDPEFVAFLFYVYREALGRLEMVLGGFSGRATRALATTLSSRGQEFWENQVIQSGATVGAYIVEFEEETKKNADKSLASEIRAKANIISISNNALKNRIK